MLINHQRLTLLGDVIYASVTSPTGDTLMEQINGHAPGPQESEDGADDESAAVLALAGDAPDVIVAAVRNIVDRKLGTTLVLVSNRSPDFAVMGSGSTLAAIMIPNSAATAFSIIASLAVMIDDTFGRPDDRSVSGAPDLLRMIAGQMEAAHAAGAVSLTNKTVQ
jgi:hypothetical protein